MFASLIISIKADIKRAKEKKQLRQKKKAQERIENNEGTASDEKIAKKPVKRSFYVFNKIKAAVVGFFESIPIVFILTKILIFVLIIALILAILAAFISTMAQAVTDMTVEASETLVFSNAFDEIKSESKAYSDGSIRTIITYTKKEVSSDDDSDDSDDSGDEITVTTNDVAFWCELSDAQIQKNIIEKMEDANKPKNEINMTANLARFIRMAYRVCYAGDETGTNPEKRILKNIEPYTLLGIVFYEKGYYWLQAESGSAVVGDEAADYWCHYDKTSSTWHEYNVKKDNPGYDKMNIDDSATGLFLYGNESYVDGPYSLSAWTKRRVEYAGGDTVPAALATALNGEAGRPLYTALTKPSGSYKAYDLSAFVIENGSEIKIKESEKTDNSGDGYAVASVLPSMILTALNFEANYVPAYKARYESDNCEFSILAGTDEPSGDIVAYYLQTAIGLNSEISGYTEVYNRYRRGLVNLAFYSYHHMSGFTSYVYEYLTLGDKKPTEDDWYRSQALLLLSVIHSSKGNIAAVTLNDIRDVKSFASDDFKPFSVDMTNYKSTIAGIWYCFYDTEKIEESEKTYTSTDFETNVSQKPTDAELKFYDFTTFATTSEVVDPTLIGYALAKDILFEKKPELKAKIITAQSIPAYSEYRDIPNLHAMLPEGIYAATTGNDLIYHFISAFGIGNSKPSSGTPGLAYDGKRWLTNGLFKGFDNKPQQGILPFLDVTIDDDKLVLGNTSDYRWELVLNEGVGYYKNDYTATHRGLDYVPRCVSGATYDDYSMPLLTAAASLYENSGGKYTKLSDAFKKYGYKGTSDFYTDMRTQVSGLPENDFRIPIVSIADGYVKSISYSMVNSDTASGSLGCCVSVRYIVLVGDTEEYIDVTYSHMGADLPFLWDREYLQGKLAAELSETGLLGIGFNYPGKPRGSGDYFKIKCGDILGYMSSTGASSVGHLHFAMYDSEGGSEINSDGSNDRKGELCSALFGMRTGDWKMDGYYPFADEWLVKFYSRTNGKAFPDASVSYWNISSDVLHKILLSPNLNAAAKLFTD